MSAVTVPAVSLESSCRPTSPSLRRLSRRSLLAGAVALGRAAVGSAAYAAAAQARGLGLAWARSCLPGRSPTRTFLPAPTRCRRLSTSSSS